jgi:hypothetical protein
LPSIHSAHAAPPDIANRPAPSHFSFGFFLYRLLSCVKVA